jgi:hypothetical protein
MATRTVTGTIYHPGGVTAWSNANVVFRLASYFSIAGYTFPEETYTAVTNAAGAFTVDIAVPTTGTAQYKILLPDGTNFYVNLAAGAAITLEALIAIIANPTADQNTLQTLIDAHAGISATTAISAHVELATVAEAQAGTDTTRAVTAAGLAYTLNNVKYYGAKGDGATDDTAAIQAAITAAEALTNNRGVVFLPDGVYLISSALTINRCITFMGNGASTVIVNAGTGNAIEVDGLGYNLNDVRLANFWIEGKVGSTNGIYIRYATRCIFENIYIPRWVEAGFYLYGALINTFINCHASHNLPTVIVGGATGKYGMHALTYDLGGASEMNCNSNTFIGCVFEYCVTAPGIGIYFEQKATGNIFIGGASEANTIGIQQDDFNYGNTFLNIHLEANGTNIVENGTSIWSNYLLSTSSPGEATYYSIFHRIGLHGGATIQGDNSGSMFIEHVAGQAVYLGYANALATLFRLGNTANAGSSSRLELKGGLKTHDLLAHTDGNLYWYLGGNFMIGLKDGFYFWVADSIGADLFHILETGEAVFAGRVFPMQHATVGGPAWAEGAIYYDTTLHKLRVGGAAGWETIDST